MSGTLLKKPVEILDAEGKKYSISFEEETPTD
jgi:hypothetical protein